MRKTLLFSLTAGSFLMMTSCSKMGPLSADNFTVTPKPLETQAGVVSATVNGAFPEKYMKKKAVVTVTPELRFGDGKVVKGEAATFQGEKVMGNDQVISYRMGGHYTMKTAFAYNPEMQKSDMYLTFDARRGKKVYNVPAVKVNYGIIATSELYRQALTNGGGCLALDSFQRVKAKKQEANIKFLINQANLRKSELKNNSVGEFVKLLKEINKDREGLNLQNVEIQAYASPEGGFKFNDKLANKRQNVSEKYVRKEMKSAGVEGNLDAHYTAQDWEGFQQLVQASNIQDKDVILRVLSMYKDPQEREQQIRNMSEGFRELADAILPELRRSRLIIHYETIGRNDEQIKAQYNEDAAKLSADELLYYATLEEDAAKKEEIYAKTAQLYTNDYRPLNNLAVMAFNRGDEAKAKELLAQADMEQIQQVLYNLLDNAIKFSNDNSSVQIETTVKSGKVFVSVKDYGTGIPKESLGKIWDRFYKIDASRGKDRKGTGLGLSIVKEIINAHNQNIDVISTEGVGTEFIFTLPLSKKEVQ